MTQTELVMDFLIKNSHRAISRNEFFNLRTEHGRIANVTARITEARQRFREIGIALICTEGKREKGQRRTSYYLKKI